MAAALVHPVHPLIGLQRRGPDHIRRAKHVFLSPGQKRDQVLREEALGVLQQHRAKHVALAFKLLQQQGVDIVRQARLDSWQASSGIRALPMQDGRSSK